MRGLLPTTLFQKLWAAHLVAELPAGGLILVDRVLLHERTGGVALQALAAAHRPISMPAHTFVTMDHVVDTLPGRNDNTIMPTGGDFIRATRRESFKAGLRLFDMDDPDQGIVHVVSPEQGIVLPGLTLVCPDSHTCTQGALGALAWGIGSTEAEHALATRTLRVTRPLTMRVMINGALAPGITAKDVALRLLARYGAGGGKGHIVEFAGDTVRGFDLEARMTLCNMATEFSAFSAIIAPDDKVFSYLNGRTHAPNGSAWDSALAYWQTLSSDADAQFDAELSLDARDVQPMVTWGTSPHQAISIDGVIPQSAADGSSEVFARSISYMDVIPGAPLQGLPIDAAFIGSCTNSRLSDLRRAAALLKGRKVAPGVRAICVPGSTQVKRAAEAEGLDRIFVAAGFEWRESGCSMCFFAGGESFGPRARVISSTNRNFESRQGPNTRTHIASPETVAASAIAGSIADPRRAASHQ